MTSEPSRPAPRPRPGVAARRRALGLDAGPATPQRETLAASLARIPDLAPDEPLAVDEEPSSGGVATLAPPDAAEAEPVAAPVPPAVAPEAEPAPAEPAAPRLRKGRVSAPPRPPWWRRIAFAVLLVGMVAAIPVLGYAGYQVIQDSTAGNVVDGTLAPTDPGYEAKVEPTPTAVAIQYDDEGLPNAITFLSLGGGEAGGGSVVFVPIETEVTEPSFGVDNLRTAYKVVADRPALARERMASQVGRILNVGIEEIIDLGSEGWTQLVEPVAPLTIDNPDPIALADGTLIPAGTTELAADQVAPYLAATREGENDLSRLVRHEVVWRAWLDAVAASGRDDAVPGETSAGISRFATALAAGPVAYETLPVTQSPDDPGIYVPDASAVAELVTDAVPSPTAAVPGSRFTVRLLNGVSPSAIPSDVVRQIVSRGGAVTILGNGPEFDSDESLIVYGDPEMADIAEVMATVLGIEGETRLDREAPDTVDLTIVLGRDVLGDAGTEGTPGSTTPETSGSGG